MVTLRKRATSIQERLFIIIEGAVRDAARKHPDWSAERLAASIAKRAVGTLTAEMSIALAVREDGQKA